MYLKAAGLAQEDLKKQKRLKWVRYERKHSMSARHIDLHDGDGTDVKVCVILDDASRMVAGRRGFTEINTETAADNRPIVEILWLCPLRELIPIMAAS